MDLYAILRRDGWRPAAVAAGEVETEEAIRGHASDADLPVTEIVKLADTVIVRPDPERSATG